jgi:hypothetical protein
MQWLNEIAMEMRSAIEIAQMLSQSNAQKGDVTGEMCRQQIGMTLTQLHSVSVLSLLVDAIVLSNLDTPQMVEVSFSALSEMVSLIMSMCDHLRTLIFTSTPSQWISKNRTDVFCFVRFVEVFASECLNYHDLG